MGLVPYQESEQKGSTILVIFMAGMTSVSKSPSSEEGGALGQDKEFSGGV